MPLEMENESWFDKSGELQRTWLTYDIHHNSHGHGSGSSWKSSHDSMGNVRGLDYDLHYNSHGHGPLSRDLTSVVWGRIWTYQAGSHHRFRANSITERAPRGIPKISLWRLHQDTKCLNYISSKNRFPARGWTNAGAQNEFMYITFMYISILIKLWLHLFDLLLCV